MLGEAGAKLGRMCIFLSKEKILLRFRTIDKYSKTYFDLITVFRRSKNK